VTFVITQTCIDTRDQACVEVCPVDCIHFDEGSDRMLYINPAECIDCGACQPACPVNAIFDEGTVPADQQPFISLNELWYQDPAAARQQVESLVGAGGGAAAAPAAEGAAASAADAPAGDAPATAAAPATTSADGSAAPAAAAAPAAEAAPQAPSRSVPGGFKFGENGVEGKCGLCGQYVNKGGVRFRTRSVLCPDCAERHPEIANPYGRPAGRR